MIRKFNAERFNCKNKGMALLYVLILVLLLSMISAAVLVSSLAETRQSAFVEQYEQTYYAAEAGVRTFMNIFREKLENESDIKLKFDDEIPVGLASADDDVISDYVRGKINDFFNIVSEDYRKIYEEVRTELTGFEINGKSVAFLPFDDSGSGLVLNHTPDENRPMLNGSIRVVATSELRTVAAEFNISGGGSFVREDATPAYTIITDKLEELGGVAYHGDKSEEFYRQGAINPDRDLNSVSDYFEYLEGLKKAADEDYEVRTSYANAKEAEYYDFLEAMKNMFDKASLMDEKSVLNNASNYTTWPEFDASNEFTNTQARADSNLSITGSAGISYLEYLYVPGNLTLGGNINFPNLRGVYVGGNLTINNNTTLNFSGSSITDFLVMGNMTMNGNGTTRISGSQFFVQGYIASLVQYLYGNSIYIAFGEVNNGGIIRIGQNINPAQDQVNNIEVGERTAAPQFYAKVELTFYLQGNPGPFYGIFGTLGDQHMRLAGNSLGGPANVSQEYFGIVIGDMSRIKGTPNVSNVRLNSDALLQGEYFDHLDKIWGEGGGEEVTLVDPESGKIFWDISSLILPNAQQVSINEVRDHQSN